MLSIFAGIGGFDLAFGEAGFRTIGLVEWDGIKQRVLREWFPGIPIYGDIDTFDCVEFLRAHGRPDVIAGGVPCQAISLLGKRLGVSDPRWKWPQTIRLVGQLRPRFCVFENPPAILTAGGGEAWNGVVSAMAALGYDCMWDVIPAAAFGAGHWRERLCIVFANSDGNSGWRRERSAAQETSCDREGELPAHAHNPRSQGHAGDGAGGGGRTGEGRPVVAAGLPDLRGRVTGPDWWHEAQSGIPVLVSGLPNKLVEAASLCIGDSVVPQAWVPIAQAIYGQLQKKFAA